MPEDGIINGTLSEEKNKIEFSSKRFYGNIKLWYFI